MKVLLKKLLSPFNRIFYFVFYPRLNRLLAAAKNYYQEFLREISSNPVFSSRMQEYVQARWQEQLTGLNFAKRVPPEFLMLPMSRLMFYKSRRLVEEMKLEAEKRHLPRLKKSSLQNFKEPPIGLLFGFREKMDCLGLKNLSPNAASMLYYLLMIEKKFDLRPGMSIIEFGGGYGSLAHLITQYLNRQVTYVIIDLPEILVLQYAYLAAALGKEFVNPVFVNDQPQIVSGKINLVPVHRLPDLSISADLFISTHALTESAPACQNEVAAKNYFAVKNLYLVGYEHKSPNNQPATWNTMAVSRKNLQGSFPGLIEEQFIQTDYYQIFGQRS